MIVTLIVVLFVLVLGMGRHIKKMADQLELLDREQHTQNKDILILHKCRSELTNMMLQHNEVLTYLAEQDEKLGKYSKIKYSGIVGEA
jgi:Tfp pilus assembly protein PilO